MSKFAGLALPVDKPARMTIIHPVSRQPLRDSEGAEAFVDIFSADSDMARRHNLAITRRRLDMRGRGKLSPEEIESERIEFLAALTTGWRLLSLDGGEMDVPFSAANARELYSDQGMTWLREQVEEFAADRGNFSRPSSTT